MGQKFTGLWGLLRVSETEIKVLELPMLPSGSSGKKINHTYSVDRIQFLTAVGLRFCFLARCQLRAILFPDATCIPWHLVPFLSQSSMSVSMGWILLTLSCSDLNWERSLLLKPHVIRLKGIVSSSQIPLPSSYHTTFAMQYNVFTGLRD